MKRGGIIFNNDPCRDNAMSTIVNEVARILVSTPENKLR
jgi:hypothetical protein